MVPDRGFEKKMSTLKLPPDPSAATNYIQWRNDCRLWAKLTDVPKVKQGLSLQFATQKDPNVHEIVCALDSTKVEAEAGLELVIKCLDDVYIQDKTECSYEAYESFEKMRRKDSETIKDFCLRFSTQLKRTQSYGTTMSDDLVAYRLLQSTNLSEAQKQLVRASAKEFSLAEIEKSLAKIFGNAVINSDNYNSMPDHINVKTEPINHASHMLNSQAANYESSNSNAIYYDDPYMQASNHPPPSNYHSLHAPNSFTTQDWNEGHHRGDSHENEVLYSKYNPRGSRFPIRRASGNRAAYASTGYRGNNYRGNSMNKFTRNRNPPDQNGQVTRCNTCDSTMHYSRECPHKDAENYYEETYYQVILFQNDLDQPESLPTLVNETLNCAVLDCGASKTCCGKTWMNIFIESLTEEEREKVQYSSSQSKYKFGDGHSVTAIVTACIPVTIGSSKIMLETDVVEKEIPLLLSKHTMKKFGSILDTRTDTVQMFGENINLRNTSSGHYAMPISSKCNLLNSLEENNSMKMVFMSEIKCPDRITIALKLHRQFAHPTPERLIKLVNQSDLASDNQLKKEIHKVSQSCETCLRFKKAPPRPCVGMPNATKFNEVVSMDIKFYHGTPILHLIDVCTRYSVSSIVKNKKASTIIEEIFKNWISIFGPPDKFLSDNGTEFGNQEFRDMAEAVNINACTSPAEAPWSNGLVERYNMVIAEMLDKILHDTKCKLSVALAWATNAKNSLQTVHGFSPATLVFGYNPRLPSIFIDKPPALSDAKYSEIIEDNLKAMRRARTAFLQAESSERIRRALNKKLRTSSEAQYVNGDTVYFKRKDDHEWHGPGKVIGQDGRMILIRNQSTWVRVHPCRVINAHVAEEQVKHTDSPKQNSTPLVFEDNEIEEQEVEVPLPCSENNEDTVENIEDTVENAVHQDIPESSEDEDFTELPENQIPEDEKDDQDNQHRVIERNVVPKKITLKKGNVIEFRREGDDELQWVKASILGRSGKANKAKFKNKYSNEWNVRIEGKDQFINFDKGISAIRHFVEEQEEIHYTADYQEKKSKEIIEAKMRELEIWKEQGVYEEIEQNTNKLIGLKWVVKPKIINGKESYKARLVAKGYQDESEVRKDSPTCSKDAIRFSLAVMATKKWQLKSIDVKCAFLQGNEIDRKIYVHPPKEAGTDKVWRLQKTIYGLRDASRAWYIRIRDVLLQLGCQISLDKGMFFWKSNQVLQGIINLFVDDILTAGTQQFYEVVIGKLTEEFIFGSSNQGAFVYIGISIVQNEDYSIDLNQNAYSKSLKPIPIPANVSPEDSVPDHIQSEFRSLVGSINWLSTVSRPDISFSACQSSTKVSSAKYADILEINKIIRYLSYHDSVLKIPVFNSLSCLTLLAYSDAAYANLPDSHSQGAYIIFMSDGEHSCPISWASHKLKRVVRSTLAAESLALLEACDAAFYIASLVSPIILNNAEMSINVITDCRSLTAAASTTSVISDKRLRVEMNAIRELVETGAISLHWSSTKVQIADRLTKMGASPTVLLDALKGELI